MLQNTQKFIGSLLNSFHNQFKPTTRLPMIAFWTAFGFFGACAIAILFVFTVVLAFDVYGDEGLNSPEIRMALGSWVYSLLIVAWFIFRKNKSVVLFIRDAIPFLFAGAVLYFYYRASDLENLMDPNGPYLIEYQVIAILEYLKALVKIVMLGGVAIIASLYFKKEH